MQKLEFNTKYEQMKTPVSLRVRFARVLSERYVQRERPNYLPDLVLWIVIIILAIWPMFSLAAAMETLR